MLALQAPWPKVLIISGSVSLGVVAVFFLVCLLSRGCYLYERIHKKREYRTKRGKSVARNNSELSAYSSPNQYYGTNGRSSGQITEMTQRFNKIESPRNGGKTERGNGGKTERAKSQTALHLVDRRDSTYSSMSSSSDGTCSVTSRSMSVGAIPEHGTPPSILTLTRKSDAPPPQLSLSLLVTHLDNCTGVKLDVSVDSASDLPVRDYGANCDPWIEVSVVKEARSLRRTIPSTLAVFKTATMRHVLSPVYSATFTTELSAKDLKEILVVMTAWDQDRHIGAVSMGSVTVTLKEAKQVVKNPERFIVTKELSPSKKKLGEIMFGLTYLPTAQRLSFNIMKVNNINADVDDESLNPYVKILHFNHSGRLMKKKKTTVQYGTRNPSFNETIMMDVGPNQLEHSTFLLTVCNSQYLAKSDTEDEAESSSSRRPGVRQVKKRDACIGRVAVGKYVMADKEREHWKLVLNTPRKLISQWHSLR